MTTMDGSRSGSVIGVARDAKASEMGPLAMYPMTAAIAMARYWVRPAAPVPKTLPTSSRRGVAAVMSSSMTRPDFSSATLCATQLP